MIWVRCNYACPLTAGPESVHIHTKDGAGHVPLSFLSSMYMYMYMYMYMPELFTSGHG